MKSCAGNPAIRLQISSGPIANRPQIHNLPHIPTELTLLMKP
jgi:hypothetical protein